MSGEWTQERHEAARAACENATEGPWEASKETTWEYDVQPVPQKAVLHASNPITWDDRGGAVFGPGDAEFIALSRTELPAALDEIERLDGRLTRACMEIGELRQRLTVTDEMVERAARAVAEDLHGHNLWDAELSEISRDNFRWQASLTLNAALNCNNKENNNEAG